MRVFEFQFLTPREVHARSDDQACQTARPRQVCLRRPFPRFLRPERMLSTMLPRPLDPTIRTSEPIDPRVLPANRALLAIENP
jgi:hypothetical protein